MGYINNRKWIKETKMTDTQKAVAQILEKVSELSGLIYDLEQVEGIDDSDISTYIEMIYNEINEKFI